MKERMMFDFGIFKRRFAFTAILQKGEKTWYTGGFHFCTGIFPLPMPNKLAFWLKEETGAESVQIIHITRCSMKD
jgi:hypothetical protein